jgi:two-component system, NarL family, sensor histidine kinase DevS
MTDDHHGLGEERLRRLLEACRSLVSELDPDALLRILLEAARTLTNARYAALGVLDEQREQFDQFITSGIGEDERAVIGALPNGYGVLGLLIRDPRPLRLSDVAAHPQSYGLPGGHPPTATFLGVPLSIRGEVWGNLYLTEKAGGEAFDEADEDVVELLGRWAASAIDNARLFRAAEQGRAELERTVRALETTTAIARAIGGETRLDRVLELTVERARALVEARAVMILLLRGPELEITAVAGEVDRDEIGKRIPVSESVCGGVLRSGHSERIGDARNRLRFATGDSVGASSALLVPLVFRARPLGVLVAFDRLVAGPPFTSEDAGLLEAFAATAAIAVTTALDVAERGLRRSIEATEQERTRWARELHDETVQEQVALKMRLEMALLAADPAALRTAVEGAVARIEHGVANLRHLITELRPASLDELGAGPALRALAERTRASGGLQVELHIDLAYEQGRVTERHTAAIEATIYRLVQEALTNAVKHAGATLVRVSVTEDEREVQILVADDGSGFAVSDVAAGFGLIGMRERVALVGGVFSVESSPGHGTRIAATVPAARRPPAEPELAVQAS